MPEKIVLLTYGSRGDIQPMVALAVALQSAGYQVRLAAPGPFASFIEAQGIEFAPIAGDPAILARTLVERGQHNWFSVIRQMADFVLPIARQAYADALQACQGADAIIHTFLFTTGAHEIARKMGVPDFSAQFFPVFAPTSAFPSLMMPDLPLGKFYRKATHHLNTFTYWQSNRFMYNLVRRKDPSLLPLSGWPFTAKDRLPPPLLFCFSPSVIPPPPEWEGIAHVTGYWFLDEETGWEPPADLLAFLESGPPPVYIGFGSTITRQAPSLGKIVLEAIEQAGVRAVLSLGWGGLSLDILPPNVYALETAPHSWLFPRMAAVVHHGGAGTTAAGLRAGVPSLLVPFTTDQPFWAARVNTLGVGPAAIPAQKLTAEKLAAALRLALDDPGIRQRATELGNTIRQENGTNQAVALIQEHIARFKQFPQG